MYYSPRGILFHWGCNADRSIDISWLLVTAAIWRDYQQLTTHISSALYKVGKLKGRVASFAPDWQISRVHHVVTTAGETLIVTELWCSSEAWCSMHLNWKLIIWFGSWIGRRALFLCRKEVCFKKGAEKILTNKRLKVCLLPLTNSQTDLCAEFCRLIYKYIG